MNTRLDILKKKKSSKTKIILRRLRKFCLRVLFISFSFVTIIITASTIPMVFQLLRELPTLIQAPISFTWPAVEGKVIHSKVTSTRKDGSLFAADRFGNVHSTSSHSFSYMPSIKYKYQINGETYRSNELCINSPTFRIRSIAQSIVDKYYQGKKGDSLL